MGNHYHVVVKFDGYRRITNQEAIERAMLLYPNNTDWVKSLKGEQIKRLKKRLFSVSEFMRNVHGHYGRWFNKEFKRHGRFWADRFKSVLLEGEDAILNCIQYIDLNPIRAKIKGVKRPEDWKYGSYYLRDMKKDEGLVDVCQLMNVKDKPEAYKMYRESLYHKGGVKQKENSGTIPLHILLEEERIGYSSKNILLKRTKHYTRGLVVGNERAIKRWLIKFKEDGIYKRRCNPIGIGDQILKSLR